MAPYSTTYLPKAFSKWSIYLTSPSVPTRLPSEVTWIAAVWAKRVSLRFPNIFRRWGNRRNCPDSTQCYHQYYPRLRSGGKEDNLNSRKFRRHLQMHESMCVTNHQDIPTKFTTVRERDEVLLLCHYCEKTTDTRNLKIVSKSDLLRNYYIFVG